MCSHPSRPGAGRSGSFPSAGLKPRNFNRRLEPTPCIYSLQSFSGRREQRIMGIQEGTAKGKKFKGRRWKGRGVNAEVGTQYLSPRQILQPVPPKILKDSTSRYSNPGRNRKPQILRTSLPVDDKKDGASGDRKPTQRGLWETTK